MATTDDMKSIAETIRKAQYGKDVREAIAQGFEKIDSDINSHKPPFVTTDDLEELNYRIDKLNERLDDLDETKATHDEVQAAKDEWKKKIEHVALGTDYETVEQAVMQILKEKGLV